MLDGLANGRDLRSPGLAALVDEAKQLLALGYERWAAVAARSALELAMHVLCIASNAWPRSQLDGLNKGHRDKWPNIGMYWRLGW